MFEAVRFNVEPSQIGVLLDAVGAAGVGFTTTETVAAGLAHPLSITTVYVPVAAVVGAAIVGF
jgi:uncharacterized membrane protein YedE/YeeE